MNHIFHQARFDQRSDFSEVTLWGSDVDFFSEVNNKAYILVEWKCAGKSLPRGQELGFRRLVSDLGQVKPSFLVVAEHTTTPDEAISGSNSNVISVRYRLPNMHSASEYFYEDMLPTLNQWLSDFSLQFAVPQRMLRSSLELWEGFNGPMLCSEEEADRYEYIEDVPREYSKPSEFFDHIRPVRDAYLGV